MIAASAVPLLKSDLSNGGLTWVVFSTTLATPQPLPRQQLLLRQLRRGTLFSVAGMAGAVNEFGLMGFSGQTSENVLLVSNNVYSQLLCT